MVVSIAVSAGRGTGLVESAFGCVRLFPIRVLDTVLHAFCTVNSCSSELDPEVTVAAPTAVMRAAMQRALAAPDGVRDLVGYRLQCGDGQIEIVLDIDDRHRNRSGALHGGIAPLLMTVAGSLAVYAEDPDVDFAANTSMSLSYLRAIKEGRLVATAMVEHLGRTLAHVTGRLAACPSGKAVAVGACVYRLVRSSRPD